MRTHGDTPIGVNANRMLRHAVLVDEVNYVNGLGLVHDEETWWPSTLHLA